MRLFSHDPFRTRDATPPQVPEGAEPVDRPLRILAWVDRYPPYDNAGGEWALHHMLRPLVAAGHRVDVCAKIGDDGCTLEGVRVHPDHQVPRLIERADVLVGHLFFTREVIHAAALAQLPLVYLFHNTFTVEHWNLTPNNLTAVVYNAQWVADQVGPEHGLGGKPSVVVRPPVHLADYTVPPGRHERTYVTIVNPNPDKGADVFYAMAERRRDDRFLAVAGAYGQQRRPRTAEGMHRNVEWQQQTPRMRDDVYARTRVVLMPSLYESWGRVAAEAMCSGIPVIAHPTPGLRECLGDAGLFVDRDDLDGWEAALASLDSPDVYRMWSEGARARADALDWQATADETAFVRLVQLAAAAESVAGYSSAVTTPAYNPFGPHQGDPATVERPVRATVAQPAPQEPGEAQAPALAGDVPDKATEVVAWIVDAPDDATRYDRATAAEYVEGQRDAGRLRTTVVAAYEAVLYPEPASA